MNLRYLVVLNPKSGTGLSMNLYNQFKILLLQANINHSLIKTEYRGHAEEIGNRSKILNYQNYFLFGAGLQFFFFGTDLF